jgi:hypothetical protein
MNQLNKKHSKQDNYETPFKTFELISKYLDKSNVIWSPFYCCGLVSEHWTKLGFNYFHIDKDFFTYEPEEYDIIVDNPPYSIKQKIFKKCVELNKPFALFVPIDTLERKYIKELIGNNDLQIIIPNNRTNFISNYAKLKHHTPWKACWFCYKMNLLDGRQLIFEE